VVGLSVDGASIVNMANDDEPVDVPARYSRVEPWVIGSDTDAEIAFLTTVFEGKETPGSRMLGPDGRIGHVAALGRCRQRKCMLMNARRVRRGPPPRFPRDPGQPPPVVE
jgi:hypothetical protein